jgi:hypothetical protein
MGMRKVMTQKRKNHTIEECHRQNKGNPDECKDKRSLFESSDWKTLRDKVVTDHKYMDDYWSTAGQMLQVDPNSSSYLNLPILAFTSVLFITLFLFDNLLGVSAITYIFNGVPFLILGYMVYLGKKTRFVR